MRFHFANNRTVQILDGNLVYEIIDYVDSEMLVTPQNADDLEGACDTHNAADPKRPILPQNAAYTKQPYIIQKRSWSQTPPWTPNNTTG